MIIFPKISLYKIKKSKIDPKGKIFFSFQQETLINTMFEKLDKSLAWRFLNIAPLPDNESKSLAYNKDFCDFIDYLVLRRDKENCDADELGRLAMLFSSFQRVLEKQLNLSE